MRTNATIPAWDEETKMWTFRPYIDGIQKKYISHKPGDKGAAECRKKYSAALAGENKSNIRLGKAWEDHLAARADQLGITSESYIKTKSIGIHYILPRLKNKRVAEITKAEWQECISKAKPVNKKIKSLAKKSLENIRGEITAFRSYAEDAEIIESAYIKLKIPKSAKIIGKQILQPDALIAFLAETDESDWYIHLWQLEVATGLRPGEAYGLQQDDIVNGMISVRRSIDRRGLITSGKNKNAIRKMKQTDIVQSILLAQSEMVCRAGIKSDWVFPGPDGCKPTPCTIRHRWSIYCKILPGHVTQYSLRHTFYSLTRSELPLALSKLILGHSESMNTDGQYGHAVDGELDKAAVIVGGVFDKITNKKGTIPKTSTKQVLGENGNACDLTATGILGGGSEGSRTPNND